MTRLKRFSWGVSFGTSHAERLVWDIPFGVFRFEMFHVKHLFHVKDLEVLEFESPKGRKAEKQRSGEAEGQRP